MNIFHRRFLLLQFLRLYTNLTSVLWIWTTFFFLLLWACVHDIGVIAFGIGYTRWAWGNLGILERETEGSRTYLIIVCIHTKACDCIFGIWDLSWRRNRMDGLTLDPTFVWGGKSWVASWIGLDWTGRGTKVFDKTMSGNALCTKIVHGRDLVWGRAKERGVK